MKPTDPKPTRPQNRRCKPSVGWSENNGIIVTVIFPPFQECTEDLLPSAQTLSFRGPSPHSRNPLFGIGLADLEDRADDLMLGSNIVGVYNPVAEALMLANLLSRIWSRRA